MDPVYRMKEVKFVGESRSIVLLNNGEPLAFPFLAICNALIMRGSLVLESQENNTIMYSMLIKRFLQSVPLQITMTSAFKNMEKIEDGPRYITINDMSSDICDILKLRVLQGTQILGQQELNDDMFEHLLNTIDEHEICLLQRNNSLRTVTKHNQKLFLLFTREHVSVDVVVWQRLDCSLYTEDFQSINVGEERIGGVEDESEEELGDDEQHEIEEELGNGEQEAVEEAVEEEVIGPDVYPMKEIGYMDRRTLIVLENEANESSAVVATCNALILKYDLSLEPNGKLLWELNAEIMAQLLRIGVGDMPPIDQFQLEEFHPKPILDSVDCFEEDPCLQFLKCLDISTYHACVGENSQEELCLLAKMDEDQISVLVHDDIFYTMTKREGKVYLLLTSREEGEDYVWRGLDQRLVGPDFQLEDAGANSSSSEDAGANSSSSEDAVIPDAGGYDSDGSMATHAGVANVGGVASPTTVLSPEDTSSSRESFEST